MSNDEDFESELRSFLESEPIGDQQDWMYRARSADGNESGLWDPALLDKDIHETVAELLLFAKDPSLALVKIKDLAAQPPLYSRFIAEEIATRLGLYVLHDVATLDIEPILKAFGWWVRICRQEGIIPEVYPYGRTATAES